MHELLLQSLRVVEAVGDVKSSRIPVMCKRLLLSTERAEDAAADTAREG